jgi:bacteriorhodopsin
MHAFKHSSDPGALPTVVPTKPEYQTVTETGRRTLWVVFIIMLLSTIIFGALASRVPVSKRLFHILTTFIVAFAAISYFAMATGGGNSYTHIVVREEHKKGIPDTFQHIFRQIFYARYIDWTVTTPLLLLDLAFLANLNGANIVVVVLSDIVMILTGLFAAYGHNRIQKWGYYTIACLAFLVIIYVLATSGRRNAAARDSKTATFYNSIALFTLILWTAYPIVWAIGDGARILSVDAEIIAYAILDVLAKPVFGTWLLFTHDRLPASHVPLDGAWSHGFGKREGILRVGDDDEGA